MSVRFNGKTSDKFPLPQKMKAVVSEINKVKKNQKPDNNQPGGIIDKDMPIHLSNLAYYDSCILDGILLTVSFQYKILEFLDLN